LEKSKRDRVYHAAIARRLKAAKRGVTWGRGTSVRRIRRIAGSRAGLDTEDVGATMAHSMVSAKIAMLFHILNKELIILLQSGKKSSSASLNLI
jgi:hypothetical protein